MYVCNNNHNDNSNHNNLKCRRKILKTFCFIFTYKLSTKTLQITIQ